MPSGSNKNIGPSGGGSEEFDADEDIQHDDDASPRYGHPAEIDLNHPAGGLRRLTLFDDPFVRIQGFNLAIVDQFITVVENDILRKLLEQEPPRFRKHRFYQPIRRCGYLPPMNNCGLGAPRSRNN